MSDFNLLTFVLENWSQFVVGIAGGFFVLLVVPSLRWVFSLVGVKTTLGYYIGGRWNAIYVDADGAKQKETATMRQFGRWVRGTIKNKVKLENKRSYRVRGSIRGNVLVATYEKTGWHAGADRGAFTLKLFNDAQRMSGEYCWTDEDLKAPDVASGVYTWYRRGRSQPVRTLARGGWARLARRGVFVGPSNISGKGVFAAGRLKVGDVIAPFKGYDIPSPSPYSLFLSDVDVEPIGVLRRLNHSCMPNAAFRDRVLYAIADIAARHEVVIDYEVTDRGRLLQPIICKCGSGESCRGSIN